jgi:hypothetical protein
VIVLSSQGCDVFTLVPGEGQCTDNSDTGSWFSLPAKGQCRTEADVRASADC